VSALRGKGLRPGFPRWRRTAGRAGFPAISCRRYAGDHARIIMKILKLIPVVTFVTSVRDLRNPGIPLFLVKLATLGSI
jgi:hypothetical protein